MGEGHRSAQNSVRVKITEWMNEDSEWQKSETETFAFRHTDVTRMGIECKEYSSG